MKWKFLFLIVLCTAFNYQRARAATAFTSKTCSSVTITATYTSLNAIPQSVVFQVSYGNNVYTFTQPVAVNVNPLSSYNFQATFPAAPNGTRITVNFSPNNGGGLSDTYTCGAASNSAPQFWSPDDGRVNSWMADRIAVYCQDNQVKIYGINNDSQGFLLAAFPYEEIKAAGPKGVIRDRGINGIVSINTDGQGDFYVAWNGGQFSATGQGPYAKLFSCTFPQTQ